MSEWPFPSEGRHCVRSLVADEIKQAISGGDKEGYWDSIIPKRMTKAGYFAANIKWRKIKS